VSERVTSVAEAPWQKIRKKAEYLGVVTAPDERAAFREAVKQFEIESARQAVFGVVMLNEPEARSALRLGAA
jgi:hypothetical protein